jgi:hypothetical protein
MNLPGPGRRRATALQPAFSVSMDVADVAHPRCSAHTVQAQHDAIIVITACHHHSAPPRLLFLGAETALTKYGPIMVCTSLSSTHVGQGPLWVDAGGITT